MGNQESRVSSNYNIKSTLIENDYFSVLDAFSKKENSNTVSIFRYKGKLNLTEKTEENSDDITHVLFKNAIQVNIHLLYYNNYSIIIITIYITIYI